MTAISSPPVGIAARVGGVPAALVTVGAVLAGNGALLGARLMLDSRAYSEIAAGTTHLLHYSLWTLCLVALSQLYPRMSGLRGRTGLRVPTPVLALAGAGVALDACARFVSAFVAPYLAGRQPQLMDSTPDAVLLVPLLAASIAAMVGTGLLAVVGLRRRVFPRGAAVLLLLGAVTIPVLGPVSNVLLGAALVWIGSTARRGD